MNSLVIYSSLTGNTKKIAESIFSQTHTNSKLITVDEYADEDADLFFIGYWVDRGTADKKTQALLERLYGKKIALFGTLGAYPFSKHALECQLRVWELAAKNNTVVGSHMCFGKVAVALKAKFKDLPQDHPHALNESRLKRYELGDMHPNENDQEQAAIFAKYIIFANSLPT